MRAKIARFYGWTDDEISKLPVKTFYEYIKAIDVLESEEQLKKIQVSLAPNIKDSTRKEMIAAYKRNVKSSVDRNDGRTATIQDVANAFARMRLNG